MGGSVLTSIIGNIGEDLEYDSSKDLHAQEPGEQLEMTVLGEISISLP